jgi:hypothetical protein
MFLWWIPGSGTQNVTVLCVTLVADVVISPAKTPVTDRPTQPIWNQGHVQGQDE